MVAGAPIATAPAASGVRRRPGRAGRRAGRRPPSQKVAWALDIVGDHADRDEVDDVFFCCWRAACRCSLSWSCHRRQQRDSVQFLSVNFGEIAKRDEILAPRSGAARDLPGRRNRNPARAVLERLGVDERTVRRYVDHLLDLGVPVESVRGRYGGYRLAPGYRMPPLMLTDDEAVAVLLGLTGDAARGPAAGRRGRRRERRRPRCGGCCPARSPPARHALVAATSYAARPGARRPRRRGCCSPSPRPLSGARLLHYHRIRDKNDRTD